MTEPFEPDEEVVDILTETLKDTSAKLVELGEPPLSTREALIFSTAMGGVIIAARELARVEAMTCESKRKATAAAIETIRKRGKDEEGS